MSIFKFENITFNTSYENNLIHEQIKQIKDGDVSEFALKLVFAPGDEPKQYSVIWEQEQIDTCSLWSPHASFTRNIRPDWGMCKQPSRLASGMPIMAVYSKTDENRGCIALSDPSISSEIFVGVVEENACLRFQINLFTQKCAQMDEYELIIRIDRRKIPVARAIKDVKTWWTDIGFKPMRAAENASLPMYSTWYSFHQHTIPDEIIKECRLAKALGMDSVIVDDGWQTDDNSRGYGFCGDWEIASAKIPDMKAFVDEIHALGMKFIIWFSVPFVGIHSKAYEKFKGMYLKSRAGMDAYVLDPRFKVVRDYLCGIYCDYVKRFGWDGLKLDFIDSFVLTDESPKNYESMDVVSVEKGLEMLLEQVCTELKKINPDIMIEFRQSYVGPSISKYASFFRVTDCPNDPFINKTHSLDLRLTSEGTPVHSDMIMWHRDETPEAVAYQLLATLFAVPQISVRFDNISSEQYKVLENYLGFWKKHRDVLLNGELELQDFNAGFSMARSKKDGQSVAALYQNVAYTVTENEEYIFNSTGFDFIFIEAPSAAYEIYDIYGEKVSSGKISAGVHKIPLKNCQMIKLATC